MARSRMTVMDISIVRDNPVSIGIFLLAVCLPGTVANVYLLYLMLGLGLPRKNVPHFCTTLLAVTNLCNLLSRILVLVSLLTDLQAVLCGALSFFSAFFYLSNSAISLGLAVERAIVMIAPFWYQRTVYLRKSFYLAVIFSCVTMLGFALCVEEVWLQPEESVDFASDVLGMNVSDWPVKLSDRSDKKSTQEWITSSSVTVTNSVFTSTSSEFVDMRFFTSSPLSTIVENGSTVPYPTTSNTDATVSPHSKTLATEFFNPRLLCGVPRGFVRYEGRRTDNALDVFFAVLNVVVFVTVLCLNALVIAALRRMRAVSPRIKIEADKRVVVLDGMTFSLTCKVLVLSAVYLVCWTPMLVTYFLSLMVDVSHRHDPGCCGGSDHQVDV